MGQMKAGVKRDRAGARDAVWRLLSVSQSKVKVFFHEKCGVGVPGTREAMLKLLGALGSR